MPITHVNDIDLYYEVHGSGPKLVLIEGIGYHRWMWYRQLSEFSRHFTTLIYDNRGVGKSDKPSGPYNHEQNAGDLAGLLDHLGWDRTHVLGVSMGGFIAQQFALTHPSRVDRLVLVATGFGGQKMVPVPPEAATAMMPDPKLSLEERFRAAMPVAFGNKTWLEENRQEFDQIIRWRLEEPQPPEAAMAQIMAGATFDLSERVSQIQVATLVISGDKDGVVPPENARLLTDAIPNSRLETISGAGHLVIIEAAESFNELVIEFLLDKSGVGSRESGVESGKPARGSRKAGGIEVQQPETRNRGTSRSDERKATSEQPTANNDVGIAGLGAYAPPHVVTSHELAQETGLPEDVLREKFGIDRVHRAGDNCHVSDMAVAAARKALADAEVEPDDIDLLVYCGSEYKDYIVWSAATHIAGLLGCRRAEAFEIYALCAGTPLTLRAVKDMMISEPQIGTALVVAASKESALVNRQNPRTRFMSNFGDGAGAAVVRRDFGRNRILGSASLVDSALSISAYMPAGGSRQPSWLASDAERYLDVPDIDFMRDRLDEVSGPNFLQVTQSALERSGRHKIDVLIPVHVKRSMHQRLQADLGAERAVYLEGYGHMQAADQIIGLVQARDEGLLQDGDVVLLLAAGVGYTWSSTVIEWG